MANKKRYKFVDQLFEQDDESGLLVPDTRIVLDPETSNQYELDLESMVSQAVDPSTKLLRDLKFDDRDIPEFPNYWDFITSKRGLHMMPYSRQLFAVLMLFSEICPKCSNPKYMTGDILDVPLKMKADAFPEHFQLLEHGKCPKCKRTKIDFYRKKLLKPYHELALLLGQRTGKSLMHAVPIAVYLLHRMIKLQRPYEVYGLNPTTLIGTLVAQTFNNAYEQLWIPAKTYIENCKWFNEIADFLKYHENRTGQELLKFQAHSIHYVHRQIMLYPAGPNRKLLRGKTRWLCISGDAAVQTKFGLTRMDRLVAGAEVFLIDGYHKVLKAAQTGTKQLLELHTALGFTLKLTAEHRVLVSNEDGSEYRWVQAKNIEKSDKIVMSGCSGMSGRPLHFRNAAGRETMSVELAESMAVPTPELMERYGIVVGEVPWQIMRSNIVHVSAYLRKLFKGTTCTVTEKQAQQIQVLLLACGILTHRRNHQVQIHRSFTNAFRALIANPHTYRIRPSLSRFTDKVYAVKTIEGLHPVYDIEVEDVHAFTANGIVVHNCVDEDQLINTDRGLIPIKEVKIGDRSQVGNQIVHVNGVKQGTIRPIFRVETRNGYRVHVSANHKIRILRDNKVIWCRTKNLQSSDKIATSVGNKVWPNRAVSFQFQPRLIKESLVQRILLLFLTVETLSKENIATALDYNVYNGLNSVLASLCRHCILVAHYTKGSSKKHGVMYSRGRNYRIVDNDSWAGRARHITFPLKMTGELAYMLGLLVSEGSFNRAQDISFANTNESIVKAYIKIFKLIFSVSPSVSIGKTKTGTKIWYIRTARTDIKEFFEHIGFHRGTASTKLVPWSILQSTKSQARHFLRGLFDGDGHYSENASSYTSASRQLIDQVQQLLLKFNIRSYLRKDTHRTPGIVIFGASNKILIQTINGLKNRVVIEKSYPQHFHTGLHFDDLLSVTPAGHKKTYDLSVAEDSHAFTAGGIVISNSAVDEWAFFNDGDEDTVRMNGTEVYTSLDNSLLNIRAGWRERMQGGFYNVPNAYMVETSSPQHARDVMYTHVKKNGSSRKILCYHLPTWEVSPRLTRKVLNPYFERDYTKAMRDFGAEPPLVDSAFITDHDAVMALPGKVPNRVQYTYTKFERAGSTLSYRAAKLTKTSAPPSVQPSVMTIDAGYSNNSFGVSISHLNPNTRDRAKIITDVLVEVAPAQGQTVLSHTRIYKEVLKPLIHEFNVCFVAADQWNSLKILQDITEEFGIPAEKFSLKKSTFLLVADYIQQRALQLPATKTPIDKILNPPDSYPDCFKYNPVDHLLMQICTVRDVGKTIDKGTNLTDDLWRAWCLGLKYLTDADWCKKNLRTVRHRKGLIGLGAGTTPSSAVIKAGTSITTGPQYDAERSNVVSVGSASRIIVPNVGAVAR